MASRTTQLCEAVVAMLNDPGIADTFPVPFTASRAWRVRRQGEELATLGVFVVPGPVTSEQLTREEWQEDLGVAVIVEQAILRDDEIAACDELWHLLERIADHLRTTTALGPFGVARGVEVGTLDNERLDTFPVFTAAVTATFRVTVSEPQALEE